MQSTQFAQSLQSRQFTQSPRFTPYFKRYSAAAKPLLIAALCLSAAACSTVQPTRYAGIESSSYMVATPQDRAGHVVPFRYGAPVTWTNYKKLVIDPVVLYRGVDNQFGDMSATDKATLTSYMQTTFAAALGKRFSLTDLAGPDTLRVSLTLTGAGKTKAVVGPVMHFDLAGNLYNGVQAVRGREGAFTGYVIYTVEIRDAASNQLLEAYVTKQYPNAMNLAASFGALGAAKTGIDKGADALVAQLR